MGLARRTFDDADTAATERHFRSGIQALARLPLLQRQRDRAAGLNTAGLISGYRGSPLGGFDKALWAAQDSLAEHQIRFEPAINEELAATAILGSQQVGLYPGARYDGVFALWYGKGPGLDRAGDALKHANSLGSAGRGGVLVVVGDDHGAMSSSMAHQCEQLMASWMMPVLHPASLHEFIRFGLLGIAMSRYSGCYVGFKVTSSTVECAASLELEPVQPAIVLPRDFAMPPDGLNIRWPDPQLAQEARLQTHKLPAAQAFARANGIDRLVLDGPSARLGIVATGKAYLDLTEALTRLGLDDDPAARRKLRLYKVGMPWPLEPQGITAFADGLDEILVVEEKRGVIEGQLKELLYHLPADRRPRIVGKTDEGGQPLLPSSGELTSEIVARAVAGRPLFPGRREEARTHLRLLDRVEAEAAETAAPMPRPPYFCSGCPHNTSTKVPEDSRAFAGTGCHLMAVAMDRQTSSLIQMGGDGANWVGQAPFTETNHVFQNLGDGTYVHSGILAVRQAVAAGVSMTFKILYNDAVAMTGGQPFEGGPSVAAISQQLRHEGVRRIAVVSDQPAKYHPGRDLAPGVGIYGRRDLDRLQRQFREEVGVTAIIYEQICATEQRRRRARGEDPTLPQRVVINEAVCEACGDCSVQSNCLSVVARPTPMGRKRMIDQSSCNGDLTCVDGYCPALVSLEGATPAKPAAREVPGERLPVPPAAKIDGSYDIVVAGIGGTGVVTIGAILGMAGHLDGRGVSVRDVTGLAQKGGGVLSQVRLTATPDQIGAARIPAASTDLLLAGDAATATLPDTVAKLRPGGTVAVAERRLTPTAASVLNPRGDSDDGAVRRHLAEAVGAENCHVLRAAAASEALEGSSVYANVLLLGHAFQLGAVPLSEAALVRAIELNGRDAAANLRCFAWGRLAAHDPAALAAILPPGAATDEESLEARMARHATHLTAYQNQALAGRYRALLDRVAAAEEELLGEARDLTLAAAESYVRLLSYKDEYEVARLLSQASFLDGLRRQFAGDFKLRFHLAAPLVSGRDGATGQPKKRRYGSAILPLLKLLARGKGLRGTPFDPFGHTAERRAERQLIAEFEASVERILAGLAADNRALAVEIAELPLEIKGFGHIKSAAMGRARARRAALLAGFDRRPAMAIAAE